MTPVKNPNALHKYERNSCPPCQAAPVAGLGTQTAPHCGRRNALCNTGCAVDREALAHAWPGTAGMYRGWLLGVARHSTAVATTFAGTPPRVTPGAATKPGARTAPSCTTTPSFNTQPDAWVERGRRQCAGVCRCVQAGPSLDARAEPWPPPGPPLPGCCPPPQPPRQCCSRCLAARRPCEAECAQVCRESAWCCGGPLPHARWGGAGIQACTILYSAPPSDGDRPVGGVQSHLPSNDTLHESQASQRSTSQHSCRIARGAHLATDGDGVRILKCDAPMNAGTHSGAHEGVLRRCSSHGAAEIARGSRLLLALGMHRGARGQNAALRGHQVKLKVGTSCLQQLGEKHLQGGAASRRRPRQPHLLRVLFAPPAAGP